MAALALMTTDIDGDGSIEFTARPDLRNGRYGKEGCRFHGGLLGVILAMFWFARQLNVTFFQLVDFVAPLVPIGLGMGRIGNFIGGELWGRATDVPWAMIFPRADALARHPSQLYQFALEESPCFVCSGGIRARTGQNGDLRFSCADCSGFSWSLFANRIHSWDT